MVEGSRLSATVQSMSSEKLLLFESQLSEAVAIEQAKVHCHFNEIFSCFNSIGINFALYGVFYPLLYLLT
ncbi:unnamed protein product [Amaranthus hypochondriacus]